MQTNYKTILITICSITLVFLISFFFLSSFPTQTKDRSFPEIPSTQIPETPPTGISKPEKPIESPNEGVMCATDVRECEDGSYVSRTGPNCTFAKCGAVGGGTAPTEPVACTMDAKMCPDGSYVGRTGPSCEFAPCP